MPALELETRELLPRQYSYGYGYNRWNNRYRWVVLGLIILGALFIFFLFSCITARRRRKRGYTPYRGTGWAAGRTPAGHAPAQYNSAQPYYANQNQQQDYQAPPAYGASQGYYGGQRGNDVELQQPQPAYGGSNAYAPPPGPPPGKYGGQNDGIIR